MVLARVLVWFAYRRRLVATAAPRALAALDVAGRWLQLLGTLPPLAWVVLVVIGMASGAAIPAVAAVAGIAGVQRGRLSQVSR